MGKKKAFLSGFFLLGWEGFLYDICRPFSSYCFCPICEFSVCHHASLQLNGRSLLNYNSGWSFHFTTSLPTTFDTHSTPTARDSLLIDLDLPNDGIFLPQDMFQYIGKGKESNNMLLFNFFMSGCTLKQHISCAKYSRFSIRHHIKLWQYFSLIWFTSTDIHFFIHRMFIQPSWKHLMQLAKGWTKRNLGGSRIVSSATSPF
jgi:hypothetical protein